MTLYVGEQVRIVATAAEYGDGDVLTEDNVSTVTIAIYQNTEDGMEEILAETAMTWDDEEEHWEYKWDTTGLDTGSYKYRVKVVGADGKPSWEWLRARLSRNPTDA